MKSKELYIIAHNIRSAHNVGAIFRSSDGAGVDKIYLSGYSQRPAPADKKELVKPEKMLAKTALGAELSVAWESADDLIKFINKLKKEGVQVVALEKTEGSVDIRKFKPTFPMALILGHEVDGVEDEVLQLCDAVIEIPMRGQKKSLNVSVATGIAIYELLG
ncbi:MAG: TRNA/rRNA methyltransferase (SpoU) [Candidatus Moranbacteria bacterium GW2011_GWA2_39_41]|nr:MAG: TRNA/rRNA methyltransferase (SpoU) [Candidatus Moranbacteria bacterium GW2011_GWA2_39_41]